MRIKVSILPAVLLAVLGCHSGTHDRPQPRARGHWTPSSRAEASSPGVAVLSVAFDTARIGSNPLVATVRNTGDSVALVVMDLRAEPGLWLIPNQQAQFGRVVGPGQEAEIHGTFDFRRMSRQATLRVTVGPGESFTFQDYEGVRVRDVAFREEYRVGLSSPDAMDPSDHFATLERGPLHLYAWKGSAAAGQLEQIADERLEALQAISELLDVRPPGRIRLVFYADEATKIAQTGHMGVGWATGTTVVEVRNDSIRLDPFHELTHIVAAAAGFPPALLSEGFAIHVTERLGADALEFLGYPGSSSHEVTCRAHRDGTFVPLGELLAAEDIGNSDRAGLEYAEAGSFVRFLIDTWGLPSFREAYRFLDQQNPDSSASRLAAIYESDLGTLQRRWIDAASHHCGRDSD